MSNTDFNSTRKSKKKRWLPSIDVIKHNKSLRFLGHRLHDPNLWHVRRYSISMGVMIGLFMCFMPMPFQMVPGAILGVLFRANLFCSIGLVWVSNPITMGPMMIFAYKVGEHLLGLKNLAIDHALTLDHLFKDFMYVWKPLWLGCAFCGLGLGVLGVILVQIFWKVLHKRLTRHVHTVHD